MVFNESSSLPPLLDRGVRLIWSADEKVSLFSANSNAKQCRDSLQQPHSWDSFPVLCSVVFRSSPVQSLFLDQNPYGGNNPNRMYPFLQAGD